MDESSEFDSKLSLATATTPSPKCLQPPLQGQTSPLPHKESATVDEATSDRGRDHDAPKTLRLVPVLDDGWRAPHGSRGEQFFLDDRPFMGTVDVASQDERLRPQPSAYLACVQRCAVAATVCLVILAFGAVVAGVSKKKSHHAILYIEVRQHTERTEPTSTRVREYALNEEVDEASADMSHKHPTSAKGANCSRPRGTRPLGDDATTEAEYNEDNLTSTVHAFV